jgi:flagellin
VNNNVAALTSYNALSKVDGQNSKSLERLSTGLRINRAADDAAGLVISETLRSTIGGYKVATRNAQDGIGVMQTADGALDEVTSMLQRMRELALNAANTGVADSTSSAADQAEWNSLADDIDRIGQSTTFGGKKLLDGNYTSQSFVIGSDATTANTMTVSIAGLSKTNVLGSGVNLSTQNLASAAAAAVTAVDTALAKVTSQRGDIGAAQNRLEHAVNNLNTSQENLTAAESRIRDTDMAQEMTNFTKTQILSQTATAMLGQANSSSQNVLSLIRG